MRETFRQFEVTDLFGRAWKIDFLWVQNAISIRHADAVDVKFELSSPEGARDNKIVSLPHPALLEWSRQTSHPITDAWCARLAADHLKYMLESGEDLDKTLVTMVAEDFHRRDAEAQRTA